MPTAAHQRSGFHDQILCNRSLEKPTLTVNFLAKNLQEIGNCSRLYMQKSHCMPMTHRSFYLISSSKQPHVGEMIIFILVDEEIKPWMLTGRGKIYFQASVSCPKIPIPPACFKPQLFGIFPKRISTPEDHISSYLPNVFLHMDLGLFFFPSRNTFQKGTSHHNCKMKTGMTYHKHTDPGKNKYNKSRTVFAGCYWCLSRVGKPVVSSWYLKKKCNSSVREVWQRHL